MPRARGPESLGLGNLRTKSPSPERAENQPWRRQTSSALLVRAGAMAPGSPLRTGRAGSPDREGSPKAARPPIGRKSRLKRMTKIYGIDKSTAALLQASHLRPCWWLVASLGSS